jgi:RNA polymerase sigma factor (sigma-70 family)
MEFRNPVSQALRTPGTVSTPEDQQLIKACLNGDERAWSALVERYKRLVYSIPIRNGFQPSDASDIFQSVCLELLEHLGQLRDATKLRQWLITVTVRKCMHFRHVLHEQREQVGGERAQQFIDPDQDTYQLVLDVEKEQLIREALEKLPRRCVVLLRHLFFDEPQLPYSQIAQKIGISTNTVGSVRERCLEKLRALLEESGVTLD